MASLNLSLNGQSIKSSLNRLVDRNPSSSSPADFAYWTLLTVTAPLANLSFDTTARESVLKVESTGEGELKELFDDLNDGRIQYAYVKVKDPNSGLPKCLFIAWCGDGVPERTKGYFTTYTAAVAKVLPGYHVQVTARSEGDLEVAAVMKKVMDASGSKYSSASGEQADAPRAPSLKPKPVFTPTHSSSGRLTDPLVAARSRRDANLDEDGWGADAPPVTRTGIEKVEPAYQPIRVNMAELTKSTPEQGRYSSNGGRDDARNATVGGSYQPVGKVDIAAIRAAAKKQEDDRPAPVKGAYEPVGKVDIAAIRAKAQKPVEEPSPEPPSAPQPVADRAAAFSQPAQAERITTLPKPKVGRKFGGASAFSGTKAPAPGGLGFGGPTVPAAPPVGAASRTFADQGGKTPAQLWAEKKAKERGSNVGEAPVSSASAGVASQHSGGGQQWKSGYTGKSWAPVQTSGYGAGATESTSRQTTGEAASKDGEDAQETPASSVSALRGRFKDAPPMGSVVSSDRPSEPGPRPPRDIQDSSKPAGGFGLPGLPNRPPPPTDDENEEEMDMHDATGGREASPIRVAVPVARSSEPVAAKREEEPAPQRIPAQQVPVPREEQLQDDEEAEHVARGAARSVADQSFEPERATVHHLEQGGKRALIQYDYEKAEDNEIELVEGEYVSNIDMVDDDWWLGTNSKGESGLFPSNYVELVEEEPQGGSAPARAAGGSASQPQSQSMPAPPPPPAEAVPSATHGGRTATALYDYEAAEDNELSFPEDAKIEGVEFPDEDWWFGHCGGHSGLFPANYVQLDE